MVLKIALFILITGSTLAYSSLEGKWAKPLSYIASRGLSEVTGKLGIYDGQNTTINQHPHMVAILFYMQDLAIITCGGSILTDSWIYTDANCVYDIPPYNLQVLAGANYLNSTSMKTDGTFHNVEKVIINPHYSPDSFSYTFALVKIQGTLKWSDKVRNISIANTNLKPQTQVTVAGYGSDEPGYDYGTLHQGNMTWLSKSTCKKFYSDNSWSNSNVCIYNKGKTTMCQTDIGGPVVHNGLLYGHVVGGDITTFCTKNAKPTIVGNTRLALKWIEKHTGPVSIIV